MTPAIECAFCRIQQGDQPAQIVHETEHSVCFFSHEPIQPGHTLIMPKHHFIDFVDIPDVVAMDIWAAARWVYGRIQAIYQPDGISMLQNNGQFNEIGHYHLHVFPRYENDGFGWVAPDVVEVTLNTLREEAQKWKTDS